MNCKHCGKFTKDSGNGGLCNECYANICIECGEVNYECRDGLCPECIKEWE